MPAEDLIPLVFFAIAWIMAVVGNQKKRRQRRQGGARPGAEEPEARPRPQARTRVEPRPPVRPGEREDGPPAPRRARDLIPKDLWEEIEALAQGRARPAPETPPETVRLPPPPPVAVPESARPRKLPVPKSPRPRSLPVPTSPSGGRSIDALPEAISLEPLDPRPLPTRGGVATGLPEVARPLPEVESIPTLGRRRPRRDAPALHRELGLHDPDAARKAMILREVLGPPLGLRDTGVGPPGANADGGGEGGAR
ncbi:MAG: hypothetical protein R3E98_10665 [Gemmatimonadota bacterium]